MNTMTYKGYTARIDFDDQDNIFVGRVLGVAAIIGFHGETVAELRADFEAAIDFMIEDCKARGISPEKPASGKLLLRVPPEVHTAALIKAQSAGKSLNQWATEVLSSATHA
jgi:predicted HicB family RNase H-like nuclease